jgi:murein L,D-transpeptidase YcbB/YkuD
MTRSLIIALGALALAGFAANAWAQTPGASGAADQATPPGLESAPSAANAEPAPAPQAANAAAPAEGPLQAAVREVIGTVADGASDEEKSERQALAEFYAGRGHEPLWVEARGLSARGVSVIAELRNAGAWGLEARDFPVPDLSPAKDGSRDLPPAALAAPERDISLAVLKYARFARGGRIMSPAESLNSNLDRKPQLLTPADVLAGLAAAPDAGAYLAGTNPKHPQFERLRQKYLAAPKGGALAKRLLANMEMWRWMYDDLGETYVLANIPEFMLYVVKGANVVWSERIVVGEIGKQTSIFSRRLKHIVFRPKWRVPESIKVLELWPSLKRGGGLMRQYGLELETKDGRSLDWRAIDWTKADIRDYEVVQPPGRKSVLGVVKFSFPSQHTIYMHDTPDRWMFNAAQRTLSHGCLRVRNSVRLAELLLEEDKGWDAAKIDELIKSGPLNNEVAIDGRIPVHLVYFTAWVDDAGRLASYRDVYGHERRVTLALAGRWNEIDKGRDHLAPVEPGAALVASPALRPSTRGRVFGDQLSEIVGGGF